MQTILDNWKAVPTSKGGVRWVRDSDAVANDEEAESTLPENSQPAPPASVENPRENPRPFVEPVDDSQSRGMIYAAKGGDPPSSELAALRKDIQDLVSQQQTTNYLLVALVAMAVVYLLLQSKRDSA